MPMWMGFVLLIAVAIVGLNHYINKLFEGFRDEVAEELDQEKWML